MIQKKRETYAKEKSVQSYLKIKKRVWIIGGIGFLVLLVLGFNLFAGGGKDDKLPSPLQQVR